MNYRAREGEGKFYYDDLTKKQLKAVKGVFSGNCEFRIAYPNDPSRVNGVVVLAEQVGNHEDKSRQVYGSISCNSLLGLDTNLEGIPALVRQIDSALENSFLNSKKATSFD